MEAYAKFFCIAEIYLKQVLVAGIGAGTEEEKQFCFVSFCF